MNQKNFLLRILLVFLLLLSSKDSLAQTVGISYTTHLAPITNQYIPICGTEQRTDNIKVAFNYTNLQAFCNVGNPYRAIVTLYKNNAVYDVHQFDLSSNWFNETFYNVPVAAGSVFKANVEFLRKKNVCIGYTTVCNITSSDLTTPVQNGTPNFNVNGNAIPANGAPLNVCISNIKLNASSTSCETNYNINVQECDLYWSRTYDYEFGLWFNGQAPDNINLQSIASTYSYPPYYTGNPARQGSILIGGNLPSGGERYYRVSICVGPTWTCKTALIKVITTCRTVEETTDAAIKDAEIVVVEDEDHIMQAAEPMENVSIADDVKLFPNPNNGVFELTIADNTEDINVEIYNLVGLTVKSLQLKGATNQIDISALPRGIYTLHITVNGKNTIKKIIKE